MAWLSLLFWLALALASLALFLLWQGRSRQRRAGLPAGRLIYSDLPGKPAERVYFDPHTGLTGKPDYLVEQEGVLIPVEVKAREAPLQPYQGHIYQVLAYCLLIEQASGRRPPYGVLRYRNRAFRIDYSPEAEQSLRDLLAEMHAAAQQRSLPRSHEDAVRCSHCGYRNHCDQRL
jgi:CRISPR-associated exonuclease Cas4